MIFLELFLCFLKIGLFSIGGGYAAMPLIEAQAVDKYGWLTISEFTDLITIAEMTPGPIAVNSATFVGMRVAGFLGALTATAGCIFPSLIIVSLLAFVYYRYKNLSVLSSVLASLRPCVAALIASAGLTVLLNVLFSGESFKAESFNILGFILFVSAFFVLRKFKASPILVMVLCGGVSLAVFLIKKYFFVGDGDFMDKKAGRILLAGIILSVVAVAGAYLFVYLRGYRTGYSGRVTFEGNPVADVSVTDGIHVVKTDENGEYKLTGYSKTAFITVTTPAGYDCEEFYLIAHKDKQKGYDFVLTKSKIEKGAAHSFVQISDTEISFKSDLEWFDYIKETVKKDDAAFLVHTGDLCYEQGIARHELELNNETVGVPVRYVIGNHDYVKEYEYSESFFESRFGPVWYSFEVGNVHYVITPFQDGSDYKPHYNRNERWRWLEKDLENTSDDMKVIIFNHNKPYSSDYVISFDRKELDLRKHNIIAWVFGHYHYNYVTDNLGVLEISTARPDCGGIDSSVSATRTVNIDKDGGITSKMTYYDFDGAKSDVSNAVWTSRVEGRALFCDTLLSDGKVFIGTDDESYPISCGVSCLNEKDGKLLWFFKTKNSIKNNIKESGEYIFAQDCSGTVYCLEKETGKLVWEKTVSLGSALSSSSGICLDGDVLYTGCAAGVTALDAKSGDVIWENIRNYGESSPAEFVVAGDVLLVSSHWDALVGLDKKTGKKLWENKDSDIRFRTSTPALIDGKTGIVADSSAIMVFDVATGEILKKTSYSQYNFAVSGKILVIGNTAIIPTADKGVIGFDIAKGEILWQFITGEALVYTAPYKGKGSRTVETSPQLTKDGNIVFAASDGVLYEISTDGKEIKKSEIGAPVFGAVFLGDGAVYLSDFDGRVSKIEF